MSYYIYNKNKQPTGEHEVHNVDFGCSHLPDLENRHHIGNFNNCHEALRHVRQQKPNLKFDGCKYCCEDCHRG